MSSSTSNATVIVVHENGSFIIKVYENGPDRSARFDVEKDAMAYAGTERRRLGLPVALIPGLIDGLQDEKDVARDAMKPDLFSE